MNWKKILRSTICLLVVLSILLTYVPVKVDALALESALGIGVAACLILFSAGVVFNPQTVEDIKAIGESFQTHMTQWGELNNMQTQVQEYIESVVIINPFGASDGDPDEDDGWQSPNEQRIKLAKGLLAGISLWIAGIMFEHIPIYYPESGGFSVTHLKLNGYRRFEPYIYQPNQGNWNMCISQAYETESVVVYGCYGEYMYGLYWNDDSILCDGKWINPLGKDNASVLGVYGENELSLVEFYPIGSGNVYPRLDVAEQASDFVTSSAYVPIWSDLTGVNTFFAYRKYDIDSTWASDPSEFHYYSYHTWGADGYIYMPADSSSIVWDPILRPDLFVGDIVDDVKNGVVPSDQIPLQDIDYSNVLPQGQTVLDSIQNIAGLFEAGELTLQDYLDMTKVDDSSDSDVDDDTNSDIVTGPGTVAGIPEGTFWQKLGSLIKAPFEWLSDTLLTGIKSIFEWFSDTILTGIKSIFVPSEDYLTAKVDALAEKFPFVTPVVTLARTITLGFSDQAPEPPIIYLHLEDSRGSYDLGGTVPFIDMSWYAEYKPIGDALLSSLLWVVFIWRLFRQLPGLISGMPGEYNARILDVLNITPPSRSLAMEVQRQNSREIVRTEAKKK